MKKYKKFKQGHMVDFWTFDNLSRKVTSMGWVLSVQEEGKAAWVSDEKNGGKLFIKLNDIFGNEGMKI